MIGVRLSKIEEKRMEEKGKTAPLNGAVFCCFNVNEVICFR